MAAIWPSSALQPVARWNPPFGILFTGEPAKRSITSSRTLSCPQKRRGFGAQRWNKFGLESTNRRPPDNTTVEELTPQTSSTRQQTESGIAVHGIRDIHQQAAGAAYPVITVTVNVAPTAGSPLVNQATVSGGGSTSSTATD